MKNQLKEIKDWLELTENSALIESMYFEKDDDDDVPEHRLNEKLDFIDILDHPNYVTVFCEDSVNAKPKFILSSNFTDHKSKFTPGYPSVLIEEDGAVFYCGIIN